MREFRFKKKTVSEKTGLISYLFENGEYVVAIHAFGGSNDGMEIAYPVKMKGKGKKIDIKPDINMLSEKMTEICLPPSILIEQIPELEKELGKAEEMAETLKQLLQDVKKGCYECKE